MRIGPRASSHSVDYYFPGIRIFVTAIPKNGSQSVLAFLTALELSAEGNQGSFFVPLGEVFEYSARYKVSPEQEVQGGDGSILTIALVREPCARISSCWIDKFLGWSPGVTMLHGSALWFARAVNDRIGLERAFVTFLDALAQDHELLHADAHWTPQSDLLRPLEYDHQLEPDELTSLLPKIVETHLLKGPSHSRAELARDFVRSGLVVERRNASPSLLRRILEFEPEARLLIRGIYSDDYRLKSQWEPLGASHGEGFLGDSGELNALILRDTEQMRLAHFKEVCELDVRLTRAREELAFARVQATQHAAERDNAFLIRDAALQERDNALLVRDAALQGRDNAS